MKLLAPIFLFFAFVSNVWAQVTINFPSCDNPKLIQKVRDIIAANQAEPTQAAIREYRRQRLVVKNFKDFADVDIKTFEPKQNYNVANRIIMLKINQRIAEDDMKLCIGDNRYIDNKIYLLMYPENNNVRVELINFALNTENKNRYSFVYDKD